MPTPSLSHFACGKMRPFCTPVLSQNEMTTSFWKSHRSSYYQHYQEPHRSLGFNCMKPYLTLKDFVCLHPSCCLLAHCLLQLGCESGSSLVFKPDCSQSEWHILWCHNCCRVCRNCLKAKSSVQRKEKWQGYSYVKWMSKMHQLQGCKAK